MNSGNKHLPTSSYNLMYVLSDEKQAHCSDLGGVASAQSNVYTLQQCTLQLQASVIDHDEVR